MRDSLGFQNNAEAKSNTYQFGVIRSGTIIDLIASITKIKDNEIKPSSDPFYLVSFNYYLQANPTNPTYYNKRRAYFPISATGEYALLSIPEEDNPTLQHNGMDNFYAVLLNNTGAQVAVNFPAAYTSMAENITIRLKDNLTDYNKLTAYYPNAAISYPAVELQTEKAIGNCPLLRILNAGKGFFSRQWIHLSENSVYSWSENDPVSGISNWWIDETGLYCALKGSGEYFVKPFGNPTGNIRPVMEALIVYFYNRSGLIYAQFLYRKPR